jgi:hypothetical protein
MFDLEQSIAGWRQQMLTAGIKTPVPLEELEIHLREEIEQQMKSGLGVQQAFENAVQKIGQGKLLKNEFQKTNSPPFERILSVGVGISTVFVGLFQVWELAAQCRGLGKLPNEEVGLIGMFVLAFILAVTLVVSGLILVLYGGSKVSWLPN